jgi:hypothetical protein
VTRVPSTQYAGSLVGRSSRQTLKSHEIWYDRRVAREFGSE